MCGIFCGVASAGTVQPSSEIQARLKRRGPDSWGLTTRQLPGNGSVTFFSTVLALRGPKVVPQPVQRDSCLLSWNGEAWGVGGVTTNGNDTNVVFDLLANADRPDANGTVTRSEAVQSKATLIAELLSQISGPYAFVFFDGRTNTLYFGRDFLGRRSLLISHSDAGVIISSVADVADDATWSEVEADGIYYMDLASAHADPAESHAFTPDRVPYAVIDDAKRSQYCSAIPRLALQKNVFSDSPPISEMSTSVTELHEGLMRALRTRIIDIPSDPRENSIHTDFPTSANARLAILFSGGLDCTLLARLSHEIIPITEPIDLLNVVFHNPRVHKDISNLECPSAAVYEACPDRITGRASWKELQTTCPGREWRFVAINVSYQETLAHRQQVITLMQPHSTEMDLSICLALYFAARGIGTLYCVAEAKDYEYESAAKVLLSGLGADELFGGYTRHVTAFRRGGFPALIDELDLDIARLGKRNLGRDDRILSHWGRETRFPYLDEAFVQWALSKPVQMKCGFGEPSLPDAIEPGKRVLRCLASKLGMPLVAVEKKRAIQFGARTAKMETGKTKGTQQLRA